MTYFVFQQSECESHTLVVASQDKGYACGEIGNTNMCYLLKACYTQPIWLAGTISEHTFGDFRLSVLVRQRNGITSLKMVVHAQDMVRTSAKKLATAGDGRYTFFNILINVCRCAARASNATTTAVLRYGFVNVGRAPVAPRNRSSALRWPQCVPAFRYLSNRQFIGSTTAASRYNISGAPITLR